MTAIVGCLYGGCPILSRTDRARGGKNALGGSGDCRGDGQSPGLEAFFASGDRGSTIQRVALNVPRAAHAALEFDASRSGGVACGGQGAGTKGSLSDPLVPQIFWPHDYSSFRCVHRRSETPIPPYFLT